jgi:hypothetical protein
LAFGFAIGDFIAVCLVWEDSSLAYANRELQVGILVSQAIQLLAASRDASSDCQILIATLRSIESSISIVRSSLDVSFARQDTVNPSSSN